MSKLSTKWLLLIIGLAAAGIAAVAIFLVASRGQKAGRLYESGQQYLEAEDYENAIAALEEALQIDPKNPDLYLTLSDAYIALGDPEGAAELLWYGYQKTGDRRLLDRYHTIKRDTSERKIVQEPEGSRAREDRTRWIWDQPVAYPDDEGEGESAGAPGIGDAQAPGNGTDAGNGTGEGADAGEAAGGTTERGGEGAASSEGSEDATASESVETPTADSGYGPLYDTVRAAGEYQIFGKPLTAWDYDSLSAYIQANGDPVSVPDAEYVETFGFIAYYTLDGLNASINEGKEMQGNVGIDITDAASNWHLMARPGQGYIILVLAHEAPAQYPLLGSSARAMAEGCNALPELEEFLAGTDPQNQKKEDLGSGKILTGYSACLNAQNLSAKNSVTIAFTDDKISSIAVTKTP